MMIILVLNSIKYFGDESMSHEVSYSTAQFTRIKGQRLIDCIN